MNHGHRENSILIIDGNVESLTELHDILSVRYSQHSLRTELATSDFFPSDIDFRRFNLLICDDDWLDTKLVEVWRGPMVLLSRFQVADVVFRRCPHGSFHCLAKPVCPNVLLIMCENALRSSLAPAASHVKPRIPSQVLAPPIPIASFDMPLT